MHYLINTWLEKGGMSPLVLSGSLSKGSDCYKLVLVKMGENIETISMEGQGNIFTFDLICSVSMCHAEGSCIH